MKKLVLYSVIILFCLVSKARPSDITFSRINTNNGLSQSWVNAIYQDKTGFMWFGTDNGLNRFDGRYFKVYLPDYTDSTTIGGEAVFTITKKSDHELWVGTNQGAYIYNTIKDNFAPFSFLKNSIITSIVADSSRNIWFGSIDGLFKYSTKTQQVDSFFHSDVESTIPSNYTRMIMVDSRKNVWVGTTHGLALYNSQENNFFVITRSGKSYAPGISDIWDIVEDDKQRLWLGVAQRGLDLYEYQDNKPEQGTFYRITDTGSPIRLLIDNNKYLWIGHGASQGLDIMDLNSFEIGKPLNIDHYEHQPSSPNSLSGNSIVAIFSDINNDIWLGTYAGGVSYYSPVAKKFYNYQMSHVLEKTISANLVNAIFDDGDFLWLGTESGLDRYNKTTGLFDHFYSDRNNTNTLGADAVYAIHKDSHNNLWIGTWNGGLNLFDYKTNTFTRYLNTGKNTSINCNNVFDIFEDSHGDLWIATIGGGLNKYNYQTKQFSYFVNSNNDSTSLYHNAVNKIYETADSTLFISAFHSLEEFDRGSKTFKHYLYSENNPNSISKGNIVDIFEDSNKNLWIATKSGLNLMNRKSGTFTLFSKQDGLPNNSIQAILEDQDKNLWFSTNKGLVKFADGVENPQLKQFIIYTKEEGIASNEFTRRAACVDNEGYFYFGTSNGFTKFLPQEIQLNRIPPKSIITDFFLFQPGMDQETNQLNFDKNINELDEIRLSYKQSDFVIQFASLNYLAPLNNQYRYRLKGYDPEENGWHYVGNQQQATYTNILPGEYQFEVYGSNNDGVWSTNSKSLKIVITPPWWQTIWFKVTLIVIFVLLFYLLFQLRFRFLNYQKKLLTDKVEERTAELIELNTLLAEKKEEISAQNNELKKHREHLEKLVEKRTEKLGKALRKAEESDRLKSSFLANMSHEIRTPMNAIVGFSSLIGEKDLPDGEREKYNEIINNSADTLLVLINDIIDISLIESDQLTLSKSYFDVDKVLEELEEYYLLRNDKNLNIGYKPSVEKGEGGLQLFNDPVRFRQVMLNLINNAYKFTLHGSIKFGYSIHHPMAEFYVQDTGIGIDVEHQDKIFNDFYKVEDNPEILFRGTGIGLSVCKKLVALMGGELMVQSDLEKGSKFYFSLYLDNMSVPETIKSQQRIIPTADFTNTTILVAEDDENNYLLFERLLRNTGARISRAKNGMEAIDFIRNNRTIKNCIILMDLKMPVVDGYEANRQIRKINQNIPIIAVTAYAQETDKTKVLKEKFDDYITKPIDKSNFISTIKKHLLW